MRVGVDVGGTNTDAVIMNGTDVLGWCKSPTTPDVQSRHHGSLARGSHKN